MTSLFACKRAQNAENMFLVVVALFVFAVISIIAYLLQGQINTEFVASGVLPDSGAETADKFLQAIAWHDWIIVLLMVVFIVAIAITSYKLATAPVFFIVTFIMSAFYGFIAYVFNVIFAQYASLPVFAGVITAFPRTVLVCTNFHWIMLANIIIGSIALYAKKQKGQGDFVES